MEEEEEGEEAEREVISISQGVSARVWFLGLLQAREWRETDSIYFRVPQNHNPGWDCRNVPRSWKAKSETKNKNNTPMPIEEEERRKRGYEEPQFCWKNRMLTRCLRCRLQASFWSPDDILPHNPHHLWRLPPWLLCFKTKLLSSKPLFSLSLSLLPLLSQTIRPSSNYGITKSTTARKRGCHSLHTAGCVGWCDSSSACAPLPGRCSCGSRCTTWTA